MHDRICHTDSHGRRICTKESFFHRVGRWIMTGCLVFFGLLALLILCWYGSTVPFCPPDAHMSSNSCIKRHRSKAKKAAANNGYPTQAYEASLPPPPPPPPPPAHVDSKDGQVTGTTATPHNPQGGAAASYYNGNYHG